MLVAFPADPTRSLGLIAYWPGIGCWDFAASLWGAYGPWCVLPVATDPASPCGDIVAVRIPDAIAQAGVAVAVLLVALDASGRPIQTIDVQTVGGGA